MNSFDSAVSKVNKLSAQMKEAALSEQWEAFQTLEKKRQSVLRLLRYDNYREIVSVERFSESIESLLKLNNELVDLVEGARSQTANSLHALRKNKRASEAYSNL